MKKFLLTALSIFMFSALFAQNNEKFVAAMKANLAAVDTAFKNPPSMLALSNNFERIANAEKSQWLPYYYAALTQLNYGFAAGKPETYEAIADKAEGYLKAAESLKPGNSELTILKSMVATMRMLVDPMSRYMQYGQQIEGYIQQAMSQDPANPRPYFIKAQNIANTPEQFGGGCRAAAEIIKAGLEKYANFKPATEMDPDWGFENLKELAKSCEGK